MSKQLNNLLSNYVTTREAADYLGVVTDHINRLLIDGKIEGVKVGYSWMVSMPSLQKYNEKKSSRGRPRSKDPKSSVD